MLAWQAVTDINRNSVHPFYKERLSSAYAVAPDGAEPGPRRSRTHEPIRLSDFAGDVPELIVCAAVNTTRRAWSRPVVAAHRSASARTTSASAAAPVRREATRPTA